VKDALRELIEDIEREIGQSDPDDDSPVEDAIRDLIERARVSGVVTWPRP